MKHRYLINKLMILTLAAIMFGTTVAFAGDYRIDGYAETSTVQVCTVCGRPLFSITEDICDVPTDIPAISAFTYCEACGKPVPADSPIDDNAPAHEPHHGATDDIAICPPSDGCIFLPSSQTEDVTPHNDTDHTHSNNDLPVNTDAPTDSETPFEPFYNSDADGSTLESDNVQSAETPASSDSAVEDHTSEPPTDSTLSEGTAEAIDESTVSDDSDKTGMSPVDTDNINDNDGQPIGPEYSDETGSEAATPEDNENAEGESIKPDITENVDDTQSEHEIPTDAEGEPDPDEMPDKGTEPTEAPEESNSDTENSHSDNSEKANASNRNKSNKPSGSKGSGSGKSGGRTGSDKKSHTSVEKPSGNQHDKLGDADTVLNGTSAYTIAEDTSVNGKTYVSVNDDENALRIDGAIVSLNDITVTKENGVCSDSEKSYLYGQNAAMLLINGADVNISDSQISSDAENGNAVFSHGEGTTVSISNSAVKTTQDNSDGLIAAGDAAVYAANLDVITRGNLSAAIRGDNGGAVIVNGGEYVTYGKESPTIHSSADITVSDAILTANNSEVVMIDGKGSVTLINCELTSGIGRAYDDSDDNSVENIHNIVLRQCITDDTDEGKAQLSITGGVLTALSGDIFYVTDADCEITLSGTEINMYEGALLVVEGSASTGVSVESGAIGGKVVFTADAQQLSGIITVDTISKLDMSLNNGSTFDGAVNIVQNAANASPIDYSAVITIDETSVWTLTGDCSITELHSNGTIVFNGFSITLGDGTVIRG